MSGSSSFAACLVSDWLTDDSVITRLRAQLGNGVHPDDRISVAMELLRALYRIREIRGQLRENDLGNEFIFKPLSSEPIPGEQELFQEVLSRPFVRFGPTGEKGGVS